MRHAFRSGGFTPEKMFFHAFSLLSGARRHMHMPCCMRKELEVAAAGHQQRRLKAWIFRGALLPPTRCRRQAKCPGAQPECQLRGAVGSWDRRIRGR